MCSTEMTKKEKTARAPGIRQGRQGSGVNGSSHPGASFEGHGAHGCRTCRRRGAAHQEQPTGAVTRGETSATLLHPLSLAPLAFSLAPWRSSSLSRVAQQAGMTGEGRRRETARGARGARIGGEGRHCPLPGRPTRGSASPRVQGDAGGTRALGTGMAPGWRQRQKGDPTLSSLAPLAPLAVVFSSSSAVQRAGAADRTASLIALASGRASRGPLAAPVPPG